MLASCRDQPVKLGEIGSIKLWGVFASHYSSIAKGKSAITCAFLAAAGAIAAIPLTWRWKLQTAAGLDLTPSMHWPAPVTSQVIDDDRRPVLVTVEYRIRPQDRAASSKPSLSSSIRAAARAHMLRGRMAAVGFKRAFTGWVSSSPFINAYNPSFFRQMDLVED